MEAQEMQQLKDELDEISNEMRVKRKELGEKKAQVAGKIILFYYQSVSIIPFQN